MDISFTCAACGKNLVIDGAGAGITIDCPRCGKPVYVPSAVPPAPHDAPARVEMKSSVRKAVPVAVAPKSPGAPLHPGPEQSSIHPAIAGGVHCLVITAVMWLVAFVVMRSSEPPSLDVLPLAAGLLSAGVPFTAAALACGICGICMGRVKQGLLVVAGVAVITGVTYAVVFMEPVWAAGGALRQMQQMMPQLQRHSRV